MNSSNFQERLDAILSKISHACASAGRSEHEVQLLAVTKTHPPESVREALDAGLDLFGESRVQEARAKIPLLPGRARWHFIGHLQKNKIRHALPLFELFHGLDTLEVAQQMNSIAGEMGLHPRVLLEVNTGGEASKFGFKPELLRQNFETLLALPRLQIEGLMTIPPPVSEPEKARPYFAALRKLRDQLAAEFHTPLPTLSMGMSGDFEAGIAEGSTLVRVGSAIFGSRGAAWKPDIA